MGALFCSFRAQTMEEIRRLEDALTTGHVPSEFVIDNAKDGGGDTVMGNGAAAAAAAADGKGDGNGNGGEQPPGDMAIG